jgi:uncharacterized protein YidB (DUF937 family)
MSFIDGVAGKSISSLLGSSSNPLAANLLQMINQQPGGLSGLVQTFHEKGFNEVITSWVGTGQNPPISADQIQHILGSQQMQDLAAKAGISPDAAGSQLAALLPTLIDKLTPNGQLPEHGSLLETGMNLLKSLEKTEAA